MELDPKKKYYAFILTEKGAKILDATLKAMRHFTQLPPEAFENLDREFIEGMAIIRADIDTLTNEVRKSAARIHFGIEALPGATSDRKDH